MDENLDTFDVCIVGGSIAGNYLSYLLSNTNLKIIVIEEHKEIGLPLQCAGIISQKLSNLITFPNELILNRVKVAKIVSPDNSYVKLSGNEIPYIIDRTGLDLFFYEQARKSEKIQFLLGEKFKSYKRIKKRSQQILLIRTLL